MSKYSSSDLKRIALEVIKARNIDYPLYTMFIFNVAHRAGVSVKHVVRKIYDYANS